MCKATLLLLIICLETVSGILIYACNKDSDCKNGGICEEMDTGRDCICPSGCPFPLSAMANSKDGLDLSTASTPAPPWQYGPSSYEGTLGQSTRYAPPTYATGNSMEAMGASVQATPYPVSPTPLSQPPPPAFTEQPLGPGLTTVTPGAAPQSAVVIHTAGFSVVPVIGTCAKCGSRVTTRVSYESGTLTWIACSVTCVFCPLFCWLIPFCIREFKDVYHYCPECYHLMGVHQRMK